MTAHEGATVLVVEDEPSIADVLTIALRYHRFEVMVAGTVRAGARRSPSAPAPTRRCST